MQILVADNNDHTREAICQLLESEGYEVSPADSAEEALRLFRAARIPIVILDLVLVGMNGLELLARMKKEDPGCEVILMTSFPSLDSVIGAMNLGALDYLVKTDDEFGALLTTVSRAAEKIGQSCQTSEQIARLQQEVEQLRTINENLGTGIRDQQTGLYGSSFFDDALRNEINRSSRHHRQFSIVLVRLNPDVFVSGEQFQLRAIDGALPGWSRTIQERLRKSDIVARYDDHTLSIILPETGKQGALLVAECLIQLCDEVTQAVLGEEIEIADLIQVGIASFPDDGDNRDKLFDLAARSSTGGSGSVH